ncbi:hypothetical protein QDF68_004154 [Klebsiella pneumoniae]|nr:hypothetical protein [Klebsiella pneumoniae]
MSTSQIISLANSIVKGIQQQQPVKTPQLTGWELEEVLWWVKNLGADLL